MVKPEHQCVNINPDNPVALMRVESICRNAGISAEQFDRLRSEAPGVLPEDMIVH